MNIEGWLLAMIALAAWDALMSKRLHAYAELPGALDPADAFIRVALEAERCGVRIWGKPSDVIVLKPVVDAWPVGLNAMHRLRDARRGGR